jgi:2-C-methyl-D-erythritol 2,4-cyclodiphosphate synthase
VVEKLEQKGYTVGNIDVTVVAERPKLREYVDDMRRSLAKTIDIDIDRVSVKASTSNGLGFIGSGLGIAAYAVALIEEK